MFHKKGVTEHSIIKKGDYQEIKVVSEEEAKEFQKKSKDSNIEELNSDKENLN